MKSIRILALCVGALLVFSTFSGALAAEKKALSGYVIGIDPGHQQKSIKEKEPNAPGSKTMKAGVSSGTRGIESKIPEYYINLQVGLLLQQMLEAEGAKVVMTRTKNEVSITNIQRAEMMNKAKADLVVRIHANGNNKQTVHGAFILIPAGKYTTGIQKASKEAANEILAAFIAETGAKNLGLQPRSDQTGFNWSKVPIVNIEMGHMTNPEEDLRLTDPEYQIKCARGITNGVLRYFAAKK